MSVWEPRQCFGCFAHKLESSAGRCCVWQPALTTASRGHQFPGPGAWSLYCSLCCSLHLFPLPSCLSFSFSSPSSTITERSSWSVWAAFSELPKHAQSTRFTFHAERKLHKILMPLFCFTHLGQSNSSPGKLKEGKVSCCLSGTELMLVTKTQTCPQRACSPLGEADRAE